MPLNSTSPALICCSFVRVAGGARCRCRGHRRHVRDLVAEVGFIHLLAGIDVGAQITADLEDGECPLVEGAEDGVIDQDVVARDFGVELDGDRAARRDQRGLHVLLRMGAAFLLYLVEDFANQVEARHQLGRRCRRTCGRAGRFSP